MKSRSNFLIEPESHVIHRSDQPHRLCLTFILQNARLLFTIFILVELFLFSVALIAYKSSGIWTQILKWTDDTDARADALFGKYFIMDKNHSNRNISIRSLLAADGVLLRPPLIGRLGNQMFSWAATWGMAQLLRAKMNYSRPVELVVKESEELYRLDYRLLYY